MRKGLLLFSCVFIGGCLSMNAQETLKPPAPELRQVDKVIPGILIDLRYATPDNFTGKVIYSGNTAWLRPQTLEKLKDVQRSLKSQGFQLVILDAYRPAWAQQKLWEAFPNANFVAPPKMGSRHTRGTTIDVSMASLDGRLAEMPSNYDEFSKRADHDFSDLPERPRRNGNILRRAMFANGFTGVPAEWWHYDLKEWNKYSLIEEKSPATGGSN